MVCLRWDRDHNVKEMSREDVQKSSYPKMEAKVGESEKHNIEVRIR